MNTSREPEEGRPLYWMPPHIRACVTPGGAILLDLQRNRYFGLGIREARALSALALNWAESSTCSCTPPAPLPLAHALAVAASLSAAGFLCSTPGKEQPFESPAMDAIPLRFRGGGTGAAHTPCLARAISERPPVEPSLLLGVGSDVRQVPVIRLAHVVNFIVACVWAKYAVKSRCLYSIARQVHCRRIKTQRQVDVQRTIELVCVFRCLRPYVFAAKDQCLFHALALLRFLSCYGTIPTWVIAVRDRPWSAHSWVQIGSLVLDCDPEELNAFTPILTV